MRGRPRSYTVGQDDWLRKNYDISESMAALTEQFNETFAADKSKGAIQNRCKSLGLTGGKEARIRFAMEQDEWLLEHYYTVGSYSELTDKFNQIFVPKRTQNAIQLHCNNLKLKGMCDKRFYADEQVEWLRENYNAVDSYEELTDRFNLYFDSNRTRDQIREKCNKDLKLKGLANPTTYGVKEKEQLPVGSIRKSQTGTYIKVLEVPPKTYFSGYAEPYWLPLQKKIYQEAYGKIGEGQMVCFLDGNAENFELDNLYCIDRKISAIMSRNRWWTDSKEHTLTAIKWCELWYVIKEINNVKTNA